MSNDSCLSDVRFVEVHPTNKCRFRCSFCTYLQWQGRDRRDLSEDEIEKVLDLKPAYVLICGGGDPTSYSQSAGGLPGLLERIAAKCPTATQHVGTHGGCKPLSPGLLESLADVSRLGISLGASYEASTGPRPGSSVWDKGALDRTLDNIAKIVGARTEKGGKSTCVSSTFTNESWAQVFVLGRMLFGKIKDSGYEPNECGLSFICTSIADDSRPSDPYWPSRLTPADRRNWESVCRLIGESDPDFERFRRARRSLCQAPEDKTPDFGIRHCPMVLHYVLAAADGYYYPCCVMAARRSCQLGEISSTDPARLAQNRKEFHEDGTPPMCADGCRVWTHTLMGKKVKEWKKELAQKTGMDTKASDASSVTPANGLTNM